jgi:hypothetical protein
MSFVGGMVVGAAIIMLLPPKYEDWLRTWIVSQWQKLTKKG